MELDARIADQVAAGADPTDEQFRLLVSSVTDYAICLLDVAGRVVSWNAGAERIKGYGAEEIIGRHISIFYPQEDRAAAKPEAALRRAEREGRHQSEGWRVRKDGRRFWAEAVITPLRDRAGTLRGFVKVTRDMTARQREREQEQLIATMFDRAPVGIAMADRSGRYVRANEAFLRLLGTTHEELIGKTIGDFTHPEDAEANWRIFQDLVQGLRNRGEFEKRYVRKNGGVVWARNTVARVPDAQGRLQYVVAMVEDITERRESAAQVRTLLDRQRALAELSLAALREGEVHRVLDRAVAVVSEVLDVEYVRVLELDPSGESLKLVAGIGWKPGLVGSAVIPLRANSLATYTLFSPELAPDSNEHARRPAIVEDLPSEERFAQIGMLREHGVVSGISVVIFGGGESPYGLIGAHSSTRRRFQEPDAEFLQAVANVVSAAVERRRALERVQASEGRLQAFTNHSPAVMFLKDREGRYRLINDQFLARFGLRREQVLGRRDGEIFGHEQAIGFAANDAHVLARGVPLQFEETARYVEGERVSVVVKFPVFDRSGAISGIGGVATDITERKLTEQTLHEQRTLLAEAQKLAGLGCWEWDPRSGRMVWSEELYRIYGVTPDSFTPTFEGYLERVHPEDRQAAGATVARALMENRGFTLDERLVRPGGEVRHLRTHGEVVRDEKRRPVKMLGACLDVTEQKKAEQALLASAQSLQALTRRLVEAEETERRRIARELHDRVGQNLSALNINLDIVLAQLKDPASELGRRLEDSLTLVDATLQSIENVMANLRPPLLDEYGLGAALGWYGAEFSRRTGLRVAVEEAREEAKELRPEAAVALFRIAQEALNNVAKHAAAKMASIALEKRDGAIVLSVTDDGKGFDVAGAATRGRWGMSTMRERAQAAGGRLSIESTPGGGTTVRAAVPL